MNKTMYFFCCFIDKMITRRTVSRADNMNTVGFRGKRWNLVTIQLWSLLALKHSSSNKMSHLLLNPQRYPFIQKTDNMTFKKNYTSICQTKRRREVEGDGVSGGSSLWVLKSKMKTEITCQKLQSCSVTIRMLQKAVKKKRKTKKNVTI